MRLEAAVLVDGVGPICQLEALVRDRDGVVQPSLSECHFADRGHRPQLRDEMIVAPRVREDAAEPAERLFESPLIEAYVGKHAFIDQTVVDVLSSAPSVIACSSAGAASSQPPRMKAGS